MVVGMQHQQQQPHASPATVLEDATTPCAVSPLNTPSSVNGDTSDSSESGSATSVSVSVAVTSSMANVMYSNNRVKLREVNPHLVCVLCHGYFVDATSIAECLHSFCRSCIILYLGTKNYCPICEVQINNSKPHLSLKPDKTLQDIVYKLVPGLFHAEMKRRNQFYQDHPNRDLHLHPEFRGISVDRLVYSPQDSICLSLEYYDKSKEKEEWEVVGSHRVNFIPLKQPANKINLDDDNDMPKKYFVCPAGVRVMYLKKLIRLKYNVDPDHRVELFYRRESLPEDYSLMDIAYIYAWKRNSPMRLYYRINILTTITESMNKLMLNSTVDENSSQLSPVTVALNGDDKSNECVDETIKRSPNDMVTPSSNLESMIKMSEDDVKQEPTSAKVDAQVSSSLNTVTPVNGRLLITVGAASKMASTPTIAKTKTNNSASSTPTAKGTPKVKGSQEKKETSKSKSKTSVPNLKPITEKSKTPIKSYLSISSILNDIDKPEAKKPLTKPRKVEETRKSSIGDDKSAQTFPMTVTETPSTPRPQTPTNTSRVSSPVPLKPTTTSVSDATVSKSVTSSVGSKTLTVPIITQPVTLTTTVTSVASKTEPAKIAVTVANSSKTIATSTVTLTTTTVSDTKTSIVDAVPLTISTPSSTPARVPTPTSTSVTNAVKTIPSVTLANPKIPVLGVKTAPSTSSTVVSASRPVPSISAIPVSTSRTVVNVTTTALSSGKTVVSMSTATVSASKTSSMSTATVSASKASSMSTATISASKASSMSTATVSANKTSSTSTTTSVNKAIPSTTSISAPNKTVASTSAVSSFAKPFSIPSSTSITVSTKSFAIPSSVPPLITLTSTPATASSTYVTASKDFSNSQYILSNTKIPSSLEISLTSSKEQNKSLPVINAQKMVHRQNSTNGSPMTNGNAKGVFGAKKAEEKVPLKRTISEEKKGDEKKICLQNNKLSVSTNGPTTKKIFSPNILPEVSITLNSHPEQNRRISPETSYDVSCFKPKETNGVPPLTPINAPVCKNIQNSPIKNLNKKLNTNVKVVRNSNVNALVKNRLKMSDKTGEPEAKKPCLENGVQNCTTNCESGTKEKPEESPKSNEVKTPPKKEARHQGIPKLIDINTAPYSKLMAQNAKARLQYLNSLYIKPPPPESNTNDALDLSSPSSKSPTSDKSDPSPDKKKIIPSVPPLMIPVSMNKDTKPITKSPNSLPKIERKPSPIAKMEKSSPRKPEFRLDNGSPKTTKSPHEKSPSTPVSKYSPIFPKTSPIGSLRYSPPEFFSNAANLNFIRQQRDLQRFFTPQLNGFNREAAATVKMYEDWIMKAYQCGALPSHPLMHPALAKPPTSQESPTFRFKK